MNELVDGPVTVHVGDALGVLRQLPSESVHCVVTSPPYWGLRDYGTAEWEGGEAGCDHQEVQPQNRPGRETPGGRGGSFPTSERAYRDLCGKCGACRIDSQLGLEPTPELYVEHLVEVFREVKRVLRRDGTCWLNLGDSYASSGVAGPLGKPNLQVKGEFGRVNGINEKAAIYAFGRAPTAPGLKPKDLVGIPWMVAFALRADGWWLRRDIIWAKPNPMPESVTDRPTSSHEYLFLLTKAATYYYDQDAIREPHVAPDRPTSGPRPERATGPQSRNGHSQWERVRSVEESHHPNGRNLRSVWTIATQPVSDAHFATYPEALVIPCIKAGTSEHGVCAECGAPWERVVEKEIHPNWVGNGQKHDGTYYRPNIGGGVGNDRRARQETGWRPTCAHDALLVPATVLDPFAGSGTTLAVARRLGRRAVGIELQADYLPLIRKRVEGSALPLLEIL